MARVLRRPWRLALLLLPSLAAGNGAPIGGGAIVSGGLAPMVAGQVRLVSEELLLRLDDDGDGYHARAEYVLENRGPPFETRYGVPFEVQLGAGWGSG